MQSTGKDHRPEIPSGGTTQHEQSQSLRLAATAALAFAFSASQALAQKKYDTGASDTEIKIGQTVPFSGAYSVYANIGKTQAAYFKMINDQGGINGRKINLIQYDDAYSPPKTVEQVRKLVEGDEVLFTFQIIGTPRTPPCRNISTAKKVPQLLASTGAARFNDPQNYPWTIAYNPNYRVRGAHLRQVHSRQSPQCQDRRALPERRHGPRLSRRPARAASATRPPAMIVGEVSYEVTDPTVDSQVVKLKSLGADLFYDASTPKFAAQAIKKVADLGWTPVHILDINASPVLGDAEAGRPRHLQGHHLDQIRQGPRRSAVEGRCRREGLSSPSWTSISPRATSSTPSTPTAIRWPSC